MSRLNILCKKDFYEKLSELRNKEITKNIFSLTLQQSNSSAWFCYREGLITASIIHEVIPKLKSKIPLKKNKAAISLCAKICGYKKPVHSKSLNWGRSKEPVARKRYVNKNKIKHVDFHCEESGLSISLSHPYLGASPDGLVTCKCCGSGILEIKCPWVARDKLINEYVLQPESCLEFDEHSKIILKKNHIYMKQIQHQMFVTGRSYCDFEVFLVKESVTVRILKDLNYESEIVPNLFHFYDQVVVPELFTRNIKTEYTCREVMEEILSQIEKFEISKKYRRNKTF